MECWTSALVKCPTLSNTNRFDLILFVLVHSHCHHPKVPINRPYSLCSSKCQRTKLETSLSAISITWFPSRAKDTKTELIEFYQGARRRSFSQLINANVTPCLPISSFMLKVYSHIIIYYEMMSDLTQQLVLLPPSGQKISNYILW